MNSLRVPCHLGEERERGRPPPRSTESRIRAFGYGSEPHFQADWLHACGDCAVIDTQFHVRGCDIEVSPRCGGQALGCPCEYVE